MEAMEFFLKISWPIPVSGLALFAERAAVTSGVMEQWQGLIAALGTMICLAWHMWHIHTKTLPAKDKALLESHQTALKQQVELHNHCEAKIVEISERFQKAMEVERDSRIREIELIQQTTK